MKGNQGFREFLKEELNDAGNDMRVSKVNHVDVLILVKLLLDGHDMDLASRPSEDSFLLMSCSDQERRRGEEEDRPIPKRGGETEGGEGRKRGGETIPLLVWRNSMHVSMQ